MLITNTVPLNILGMFITISNNLNGPVMHLQKTMYTRCVVREKSLPCLVGGVAQIGKYDMLKYLGRGVLQIFFPGIICVKYFSFYLVIRLKV